MPTPDMSHIFSPSRSDQHASKFPAEIEAYFLSRWNRRAIWQLDLVVQTAPLGDFTWHLDQPFWSSQPPQPRFDLRPRAVLEDPDQYAAHHKRILAADARFPLDVARFGSRIVILDGIHRLARMYRTHEELIRFRLVPQDAIAMAPDL
jgi:hypothetical protein